MTPEEFIYKKKLISPHSYIFTSYGDKDYTLVELLTEYAALIKQNSHKHSVMQAEGSDGVSGATVGNSAAGQSGSVGCSHKEVIYYKGYICKECELPIKC